MSSLNKCNPIQWNTNDPFQRNQTNSPPLLSNPDHLGWTSHNLSFAMDVEAKDGWWEVLCVVLVIFPDISHTAPLHSWLQHWVLARGQPHDLFSGNFVYPCEPHEWYPGFLVDRRIPLLAGIPLCMSRELSQYHCTLQEHMINVECLTTVVTSSGWSSG